MILTLPCPSLAGQRVRLLDVRLRPLPGMPWPRVLEIAERGEVVTYWLSRVRPGVWRFERWREGRGAGVPDFTVVGGKCRCGHPCLHVEILRLLAERGELE